VAVVVAAAGGYDGLGMRSSVRAAALFVTAVSRGALADEAPPPPRDIPAAERLFEDGKRLMDAGRYAEACPLFEESLRLDPGTGTLLNLALCNEGRNKLATAWAQFGEVTVRAARVGRADRVDLARKHASALERRLSQLTVAVTADGTPGLVVQVDGAPRARVVWGRALPIDGGEHVVMAAAPHKRSWSTRVSVAPDSDAKTVVVPALEDDPEPAKPPPGADRRVEKPRGVATKRTLGWVLSGAGGVALGIGGVFGVLAVDANTRASSACSPRCTSRAEDLSKTAVRDANIANVGIGLGVVALAAGIYMLVTSGSAGAP